MTINSSKTVVETQSYRLPRTATPAFYDIKIAPNLERSSFSGEQTILLEIHEPLAELVLNAADLTVSQAELSDDSGNKLFGTIEHIECNERVVIKLDSVAAPGHWQLELKFQGELNKKLKGFYRSTYKNELGQEESIATTKFEPCDARRAFPCWDEPDLKARFKISLLIDDNLNAVSNAHLIKTSAVGNGKKLLEFAPTIKMSTYLVAYVIGKLEASEPMLADGKELRVWSIPGKKHLHRFALTAAKFSLEYFAKYFRHPYPGDKLDLIAIPDFASGAMENFGCITFRETALLVDDKTASHAELERVAEVVLHENAHMWFGDLVTMSWWNGLWLNEAFATFMAAKALAAWKPEWKFWEGFNVSRAGAMRVDGLNETRSIEFPVHNPEDARQMFDVLTYDKGCAILRMLELFLGEEDFRKGVTNYIQQHQFANADTPDLWRAIEKGDAKPGSSTEITVGELMDSWVFQPGYPLINVEESSDGQGIICRQRLFRYLTGAVPNTTWHVPIHIRSYADKTKTPTETTVLLSQSEQAVALGCKPDMLVVNAGGHGFYRVHYSNSLRNRLLANLHLLTTGERFNFVNDLWAAVQSGDATVSEYLVTLQQITEQFGETDVNVFSIIIGSLNTLRRIISKDAVVQAGLRQLAATLIQPALSIIGESSPAHEDPLRSQLRGSLLSLLGQLGDETVVRRMRAMFEQYKQDRTAIDANLLGAMVETLASHGDEATYAQFIQQQEQATTPQEEQRFLMALASFRDEKLIERTLHAAINGQVRTQDAPFLVLNVMLNPFASKQAWLFLQDNWETMVAAYPMQGITRLCAGVTALVEPDLEQSVIEFFKTHQVKGGEKAVKQYLEQLRIAILLSQREKSWLIEMLQNHQAKSSIADGTFLTRFSNDNNA